jgi:hypothetical protein
MKTWVNILFASIVLCRSGQAQSFVFVNLDFESSIPTNVTIQNGIVFGYAIIPGWTAFLGGSPLNIIRYNFESSDGGVTLIGTDAVPPIEGNYFIVLKGSSLFFSGQNTAGIGQTGTIPLTAQSLSFWGDVGANDVSFDGQTLSLTMIGSAANYNIYEANISAFAGQAGQLLFTVDPGGRDMIDNIRFSSSPVPEPISLALTALGGLLLRFCRWRKTFMAWGNLRKT